MKYISVLITMLLVLSGCDNSRLVGTWVREDESLQGLKVQVFQNDNSMYAQIVDLGVKDSYYKVGETKWKDIKKVGESEYEMEDLLKGYYSDDVKYTQSHLRVQGDMVLIDLFYNDGRKTGTHQVWTRVKEN